MMAETTPTTTESGSDNKDKKGGDDLMNADAENKDTTNNKDILESYSRRRTLIVDTSILYCIPEYRRYLQILSPH